MKIVRYVLGGLVLLIIVLGALGAFTVNRWLYGPLPQHAGTLQVDGLRDRVEVIRDTFGVPHVYASNVYDLRFAQGFVQAQDRWWQMEFSRRTGRGELQEVTGKNESLMSSDIFIRAAGWRRAAERDLEQINPDVLAELQAFADGVNAYISSRPASELALEYNVLGLTGVNIEIMPWTPLDTTVWTKVMAWDLGGNQSSERRRSALIEALGQDMVSDFMVEFPYGEKPTIIQPEDFPATATSSRPLPTHSAGIAGIDTRLAGNFDDQVGLLFADSDAIGSNNWVVSGDLTESGMPLLANDPHLGIQMPSIWYEIGLYCQPVSAECPYSVRGFTFPAAPGVVLGHNERIGWGVTNVGWDTQDLYQITVNPDNDLQYEWNGAWRDMTVHEETIRFGDGGEFTIRVRETHLGPIINDYQIDEETGEILGFNNENPLALRWTSLDPGTTMEAILRLNRATNWDEFREALSYWDSPAQNFVYADVEGNIGYQTPGRVPVRAAEHSGMLPVDGSTDAFEWLGFVPYEYLPSVYNPERGYIATANQALVPLEYYDYLRSVLGEQYGEDANYMFDREWDIGYRGQRIVELLEASTSHNFDTFRAIQGDNKLILAEDLAPYLRELDLGSETLNETRDWMLNWDYQMHMDSPQAALFVNFWARLVIVLYEDQFGEARDPNGDALEMWATTLLAADPDNVWWDDVLTTDVVEDRDQILIRAFSEGYDATVARLGADRDQWKYGAMHTSDFVSFPLGASGIEIIENLVNSTSHPTSGGSGIVNATGWALESDLAVDYVPSMRTIIDFSNLAASYSINTTGQSGHPASPDYTSFIDSWRMIEYHPMYFARSDIEANAKATLILEPGS